VGGGANILFNVIVILEKETKTNIKTNHHGITLESSFHFWV